MVINVGDTIFFEDKIWKIREISKLHNYDTFYYNRIINGIAREIPDFFEEGSDIYTKIVNNYVKDGTYIISKAKFRELRINQILE